MEWPGDCLDVGRLQKYFPELRDLDIVNCTDITNFKGYFDETSKVQVNILLSKSLEICIRQNNCEVLVITCAPSPENDRFSDL